MGNPFEDFKKAFQTRELIDLHKKAVDRVGSEKVEYGLQVFNQLWDHFAPKYGEDRASQIVGKVTPPPPGWNVDRLIHVGERWHLTNLLFHKKIDPADFETKLAEVDAMPH